jgi:hypothetical protein
MFGLALRTYQRKVQRVEETIAKREQSLWEGVLDFVTERGSALRTDVLAAFAQETEVGVIAVLTDLTTSGLIYSSGRGESALYAPTSDADRRRMSETESAESLSALVWASIYRRPGSTIGELASEWRLDVARIAEAVESLVVDGRVERAGEGHEAALSARTLVVPVGAKRGWEGAIYEHFCAVASAIGAKVARGKTRSDAADRIGGATLAFDLSADHPLRDEVLGLLPKVRTELNALWGQVHAHNQLHPCDDQSRTRVTFYFGQNVDDAEGSDGGGNE